MGKILCDKCISKNVCSISDLYYELNHCVQNQIQRYNDLSQKYKNFEACVTCKEFHDETKLSSRAMKEK